MTKIYLITIALLVFLANHSTAQVYGCTDPLANNYNSSATDNDGSCTYSNASVSPVTSVNLDSTVIETSGLIKWGDYVWTHNDNSDTHIYSLDTITGSIVQAYQLNNVVNNDMEEISQDSAYVYLGDFGNNVSGNRTNLYILRIEKSSLLASAPVIDTIFFSYSDQTDFTAQAVNSTDFDCESFIVSNDSIYLFTKQWVSTNTSVYSLPKTPGTYTANLLATYNVAGLITGATYLESKRLIVLCGYSALVQPFIYLLYDFNGHDFFSGNKRKMTVSLPFHQIEGIATSDGLKYYLSNEHLVQLIIDTPQKLHTLDLSSYLNPYLDSLTSGIAKTEAQNDFQVYPNPAANTISINTTTELSGTTYFINDQTGRIVFSGKLTSETNTIDISQLSPGFYILQLGEKNEQLFKLIKK